MLVLILLPLSTPVSVATTQNLITRLPRTTQTPNPVNRVIYTGLLLSGYLTMMILPHVGPDFVATVHPGVGYYDADPDGGGNPHGGGFDGVGGGGDYPQGGMDSSV